MKRVWYPSNFLKRITKNKLLSVKLSQYSSWMTDTIFNACGVQIKQ